MHYFEIIKYDDILWIFKRLYYYRRGSDTQEYNPWLGYKTYGELIFITKDKKIHQMGYINKEQIFKNKILEKNSNIFFGRSASIIKKAKQLYKLNIHNIDFRVSIRINSKIVSVLFLLYIFFNL